MNFERKNGLARAIRHASASWRACASMMVLGVALGASGGVMAEARRVNIPAQPLDQALLELGQQTGMQILYGPELVSGKRAPAVVGNMEPQQALEQILGSAGLKYRIEDNTVYLLNDAPVADALELNVTTIQGQGMGQMTENSGSYTPNKVSAGSKTPTSLRSTPQSVSVITNEVMRDKSMNDLTDAMAITPGITVQQTNERIFQYYSRGFAIENIQIDGAAPMALGTTAGSFYSSKVYNLAEFDHVEVLRGASGLFGGTGDPGGIINLVRKRPLDTYQLKVEAAAGSWDNYRTQVDVTGPLAFDGKLRGRLVTAYTDRQYFIDERSSQTPTLYGILEADVTPDTRLTLGGRYERINENGSSAGLPRYSDGRDLGLARHTNLTDSWAFQDGRSQEIFAKVDHAFSDDWKANFTYTQTQETGSQKRAFNVGALNPITNSGPARFGSYASYKSDQQLADINLAGKFQMLGREQEFLLGADHQRITSRWQGTGLLAGALAPINVFDPDSTPWAEPPTRKDYNNRYKPNTQVQYGLYSTLRLHLTDPLHVILGARAQRYKFEQEFSLASGNAWNPESTISMREPTKVVPYGGIVYDLSDDWSAYASYSEIYKPQQDKVQGPKESGSAIEAMKGHTYETGIKGELFGGALNTNIALYYTKRENQAIEDPRFPAEGVLFGGSCCWVSSGEVVSKGVDLEVSGEILPDWSVIGGYTYNHSENRTNNSAFSTITPKHLFKLWSVYRLPGEFSDFKVGGGVNAQSASYVSGTASLLGSEGQVVGSESYDYRQPGYAVWGSMAEYRLDDHWTLTYNFNNMFDKKYYLTVGSSVAGNWYGEPRNHILTLRGTFW
ncbi:TonB-dependent siderophore receptor [Pseudomonas alabamensis]|uniref:TonB-dependent siderophore receptor n=1 Tax=Pseudomonas alabamensis TaxID=3064349 RepID=UPI003F652B67